MRKINFTNPSNQLISDTAKKGMVACLKSDASTVADRGEITLEFCFSNLANIIIDSLTEENRVKLVGLLKISSSGLPTAKLTNLYITEDVVTAEVVYNANP